MDAFTLFPQGQAPISGGYIELRHSKHTDPAIRREQLIRAGTGALPVSTNVSIQFFVLFLQFLVKKLLMLMGHMI